MYSFYHSGLTKERLHMQITLATTTQGSGGQPSRSFREFFSNAIGFWEPRRLVYNFCLAVVVLIWLTATWPHFRPALSLFSLLRFCVLGLLANLCYCAAYLIDIPIQHTVPEIACKNQRWILWLVGTLFAIVLANYWIADEIYPDFH